MKITVRFNPRYFLLFVLLFIVEVLIALFPHNTIIRSYMGDVLVVILMYCFVRSFFNTPVLNTSLSVLLFSCFIEMLQYFKIVNILELQQNSLAKIVVGTSFSWLDIVSYTVGIIIVLVCENLWSNK